MAHVFLDTNFVVETIGLRKSVAESENLDGHEAYISPLTIHIMCYAFKRSIPDEAINSFVNQVHIIDFSEKIINLSLLGPTPDFEDNVQLHSANLANADYFITHDQELLNMGVFGKTKIVSKLLN